MRGRDCLRIRHGGGFRAVQPAAAAPLDEPGTLVARHDAHRLNREANDDGGHDKFSSISRASIARSPKRLNATLSRARKARVPSTPGSAYRRTENPRQRAAWRRCRRRMVVGFGEGLGAGGKALRGSSGRGRKESGLVSCGPAVVACDTGPSRFRGKVHLMCLRLCVIERTRSGHALARRVNRSLRRR